MIGTILGYVAVIAGCGYIGYMVFRAIFCQKGWK